MGRSPDQVDRRQPGKQGPLTRPAAPEGRIDIIEAALSHTRFTEIISCFCAAVSNALLYGVGHPLISEYAEKTCELLGDLFKERDSLTVFLVDNDIILEDQPVQSLGMLGEKFTRVLQRKGIQRLTFSNQVSPAELAAFIEELASATAVSVQSRPGIMLGKVELYSSGVEEQPFDLGLPKEAEQMLRFFNALRDSELDRIKELYSKVKRKVEFDANYLDEIVKRFIQGFGRNVELIRMLASVKFADEYTFTHVVNVGILTIAQAERLGFSGRYLHQIGVASMLHDVGKTFIPEEILNKPGRLTQKEREVVETHTIKGGSYLLGFKSIPKIAVIAAMEHHLKYDGSGYPFIKQGWRPNIVSQMIAISDVFDALRSQRVYSQPKPMDVIREILVNEKGSTFNPALVENFLAMVPDNYRQPG